jgi:hypothetical protein
MGKIPRTSLKVKDFTCYPFLLRKAFADDQGYHGVTFVLHRKTTQRNNTQLMSNYTMKTAFV